MNSTLDDEPVGVRVFTYLEPRKDADATMI
jgi:hypothetical protein